MFIKSAKCPHCERSLPLCSAFYKISLPPREIKCTRCSGTVKTTFDFRMNWISHTIFRLSVLVCTIYIFIQSLQSNTPLIFGVLASVVFGFLAGAVFSFMISVIAAPVLQIVLDTGHVASKAVEATSKSGKKAKQNAEEARLAEFVGQDSPPQSPPAP